ncbi:MAG TPA: hypothetical protein VIK11_11955 [Tepidiformaceae bacterium]|jgi:hypothetical protein
MLAYLPFLIGPKSFGVIALLIFLGSAIVIPIPVFATRGRAQVGWLALSGLLLTVEVIVLVTLQVMVSNGTIWKS